jgi:hypothetical protein
MHALTSETEFPSRLPGDHLKRLPEWCVYVEADLGVAPDDNGFFAAIDQVGGDPNNLNIVLLSLTCELLIGLSFAIPINCNRDELAKILGEKGADPDQVRRTLDVVAKAIHLVLYLCADDAEMQPTRWSKAAKTRPRLKPGRNGERYMPQPDGLEIWNVGYKIGAQLRASTSGDVGGSVRPHTRRAHWHHYWVGSGDEKQLRVRWLPPIRVKLDDAPTRSTIKRVDQESRT